MPQRSLQPRMNPGSDRKSSLKIWSEARFVATPDGAIWTVAANDYAFWTRYLDVFDEVAVVARVRNVSHPDSAWTRVDGPCVRVLPLPYYHGGREMLLRYRSLRSASVAAARDTDYAMLFRVPSFVAPPAIRHLRNAGRPYALEVVGDPDRVFATAESNPMVSTVLRHLSSRALRHQCANAAAISYVTRETLQSVYPPGSGADAAYYSSVLLTDESFVNEPRSSTSQLDQGCRLATIASMDQPYKGVDTLIDAISLLRTRGLRCSLDVVGDGKLRPSLEARAHDKNVGDSVRFLGALSQPSRVIDVLDSSDMFVLASRTEGLPRSLIEAMARALPCVATHVGGIPELLETEQMVAPDSPEAFAEAIALRVRSPRLAADESARNLMIARTYSNSILSRRRTDYYERVASMGE